MAQWSVTTYTKVYKARYPNGITPYLPKEEPFIGFFRTKSEGGSPYKAMIRTNAVRGSSDFATALANRNASSYTSFDIEDFAEEHIVVSISRKLMKKAGNNEDAIVSVVEQAVDAAKEEAAISIANKLQANGGGSIGVVASFTSTTITLVDASGLYLFRENMRIQASDDDGATASPAGLRDSGAAVEITGMDDSSGSAVLTYSPTSGIPSLANGDFLFREGDYDSFSQRIIQGMTAWCPKTAPGGTDDFFGVNRSTNVPALAGKRMNAGGKSIFDVFRLASARLKNNRAKFDSILCNPLKQNDMDQAMGAKQTFTMKTAYAGVELEGIKVSTAAGMLNVYGFSVWPENDCLLTNRESWELVAYGQTTEDVDEDGNVWHLEQAQDAYQRRVAGYPQLVNAIDGKARTQDNLYINFGA